MFTWQHAFLLILTATTLAGWALHRRQRSWDGNVSISKLAPRSYTWLDINAVKPRGWLLKQEQIQASTLGGHLQEFFLTDNQWLGGSKCPMALCESVPYWLNGLIPLAVQLDSDALLSIVHRYIKGILDRQQPDGWLGPGNITSGDPSGTPWSRYRMLSALAQYANVDGADPRTIETMRRLVIALNTKLNNFSIADIKYKFPWAHARWQELVYNAQWLVDRDPNHEGNDKIFDAMQTAMDRGLNWQGWYDYRLCENSTDTNCFPCREYSTPKSCEFANSKYFCQHGVNVPQSFTTFGVIHRLTGNQSMANAAKRAAAKLDYCHGQPGGVWSAHEELGGIQPNSGTETCSVVETMNVFAELFSYFGDIEHLDRIEKVAFNRLPASYFNGSMWSLTYFHQTNDNGGCNHYGLPFECCVANGNQGWPKLTSHLYARRSDNELAVLMYAPSYLNTSLSSDGQLNQVQMQLDTRYPFSENLHFRINATLTFKLHLRIPIWASGAIVQTDGRKETPASGIFHILHIPGGRQTIVDLTLPLEVSIKHEAAGGVSVHAGPLLFALDLAPVEHKSSNCYFPPDGCDNPSIVSTVDWRTALALNRGATGGLKIDWPTSADGFSSEEPFQRSSSLPRIHARGVSLRKEAWPTVNCTSMESGCAHCVGPAPYVNVTTASKPITLLPFGATDVRIAILPVLWLDRVDNSEITV